ncbi:PLP-dependent aminotransferase family protein [Raoultella terrigena]|uniref:aminotransferase-like domain-containing protein n=1 Tax=Raoultella terrigena TaxID=577 RepID=UPI00349FB378
MLPRYQRIALSLRQAIIAGALHPGDRLLSVRKLAEREQVSIPTAQEALRFLEAEGLIVARPRSGYYVSLVTPAAASGAVPNAAPVSVDMSTLARTLFSGQESRLVPPGAAQPDPAWLPAARLQRVLQSASRRLEACGQTYSMPPGRADLRYQIARRAVQWGATFGPDELIVTGGATQAVRLALQAVCVAGDVVAIERPAWFGALLLLESMGLRALEIATDPQEGISLPALNEAIVSYRPAAVLVSPSAQNPTGAVMPVAAKRELVSMLERHGVPLIEDDVYGDLVGDGARPPACKAFDRSGSVLYCSSVSKALTPGWRTGWIAPGRYYEEVMKIRLASDWAGSPLTEAAVSDFMSRGDYDRHLLRLKSRIQKSVDIISRTVAAQFPEQTRVVIPQAGFLMWVELPKSINALDVHRAALEAGIGVSPGQLFSPRQDMTHYLRLNCACEPTPQLIAAVIKLGEICRHADNKI